MGSQGMTMTDPPDRSLTFLVADDHRDVRKSIRKMLNSLGHTSVLEGKDGLDAWQRLLDDPVDVAIVDLFMPGLDGIGLLRRVRKDERLRNLPFIMVTGELAEEIVAEAAETDVDAYIIKPFAVQTLKRRSMPCWTGGRTRPRWTAVSGLSRCSSGRRIQPGPGRTEGGHDAAAGKSPRLPAPGGAYVCRGMLEDAEKAFRKAIHCEPRFTRAYDSLARCLPARGTGADDRCDAEGDGHQSEECEPAAEPRQSPPGKRRRRGCQESLRTGCPGGAGGSAIRREIGEPCWPGT